jgi:hypothetical protein
MKNYKIDTDKNMYGKPLFNIHISFKKTQKFVDLIESVKGVSRVYPKISKYELEFEIGEMFSEESVKKEIEELIDCYVNENILSSNADNSEKKGNSEKYHLLFCEKLQQFQVVQVGYTISMGSVGRYNQLVAAKYEFIARTDSKIELTTFAHTLIAIGESKTINELQALFAAQKAKRIAVFSFEEGDY